jgi:Putative transposase
VAQRQRRPCEPRTAEGHVGDQDLSHLGTRRSRRALRGLRARTRRLQFLPQPPDGSRWIACKPGFFLPVRVVSRLFRRLFLDGLAALNEAGRLALFGDLAPLADKRAFDAALAPLRRCEWVVYAKRPFAGPKAVLAYLSRYTHRVAISNSRLIALDDKGVTFKWKDYRIKGRDRLRTMTLEAAEFIRRFLLHVLPSGFHRIRHYGLFAGTVRARNIERARHLLNAPESSLERPRAEADSAAETASPARQCPCCGGRMIIVETFQGARPARSPSPTRIRVDTS